MKAVSNAEFASRMLELARAAEPFAPTATYDPDGDCVEFLSRADAFFAERVDDLVTVYYSQDTEEVIGALIKGVNTFCKKVLEKNPGFKIEIIDGRVKLVAVFQAGLWSAARNPDDMATVTYQKLIEVAQKTKAVAELSGACR